MRVEIMKSFLYFIYLFFPVTCFSNDIEKNFNIGVEEAKKIVIKQIDSNLYDICSFISSEIDNEEQFGNLLGKLNLLYKLKMHLIIEFEKPIWRERADYKNPIIQNFHFREELKNEWVYKNPLIRNF